MFSVNADVKKSQGILIKQAIIEDNKKKRKYALA